MSSNCGCPKFDSSRVCVVGTRRVSELVRPGTEPDDPRIEFWEKLKSRIEPNMIFSFSFDSGFGYGSSRLPY